MLVEPGKEALDLLNLLEGSIRTIDLILVAIKGTRTVPAITQLRQDH